MDKPARSYSALILISCAAGLGCYSVVYMRIPIIPLYAHSLGVDIVGIGVINSLFMLGAGTSSVPLGMMSDRLGRKRLILAGVLISTVSSFLLAFSGSAREIMVVYGLAGIGIAAFATTMMSFVADFSPPTHLGRSFGWFTMATNGGMSLGPAAGGIFASLLSFRWAFAISGIMGLAVFMISLLFFPGQGPSGPEEPPKKLSRKAIRSLASNRPFLACLLGTLCVCFSFGVFITFLPLQASRRGIAVGEIGVIFAMQATVNALCRIPFGYMFDRVSNKGSLVPAGLLAYSVSNVGLAVSASLAVYLISASGAGIAMGIVFTSLGALVSELVPPDLRGLAMGGYNGCIYIGMMLGALIMGVVSAALGFTASFLITAALLALGAMAFSFIFKSISIDWT